MAMGQKIFWGFAFPVIFLVLLDFIQYFALDQNSIIVWGLIQIVFWCLSFIIGVAKLIISALLIYPLSLMIASIPDPFANGFGIGFIWDLLKSFFGLLLYLIAEGVMSGGDFFFQILIFFVNLFITNPDKKIATDATAIIAYNLLSATTPSGPIGSIVIVSNSWFDNIGGWFNETILDGIKTPSAIFWEDILMTTAPDWGFLTPDPPPGTHPDDPYYWPRN